MNKIKLPYPLKVSIAHNNAVIFEQTFTECPIIIGRSSKCDIALSQFDFLSRQHCVISVENEIVEISDLDSSNGIFFDGQRVKKAIIRGFAEIQVGEVMVTMELDRPESEADTATLGPDDEITNVKEIAVQAAKKPAPLPSCPVVDAKKTQKKNLEAEMGAKLSKQPRIPFTPPPTTADDVLPRMIHFGGEHKVLNVPLDQNLKYKEQEPSVSVSEKKPIIKTEHKKSKKQNSDTIKSKPVEKEAAKNPEKPILVKLTPNKSATTKKPISYHMLASQLRPQQRVLESYVTWKDQIYDLNQFYAGEDVIIPVMEKNYKLAHFDGMNTQVYIPERLKFELENETKSYSFEESRSMSNIAIKKNHYVFKLGASELVSVQITSDIAIHLRYAPAPRELSNQIRIIKDEEMKTPGIIIGAIELFIFMLIFFTKTKELETPQKIMQERVAKLIIEQKPPPPPPPPVEEKKPEPKVAEKKPEPRVPPKKVVEKQPKPKKIVKLQKSKILTKINKYPVEVEKPMKVAERPVVKNIQAVGALAALGAVSSKIPPSDVPVAININKNAGGATALNTGGVIGTLKTSTGKLAAGGFASVKTKGMGYGTGTGYGVQGIKGTAGSRSVAGTVVGAPSLVNLSKEEGLTRDQVMDVVKRYMSKIQQCYERSMIDSPGLAGRVEYEWEISPKGKVQWAKVKKSDISGGDTLNKCVTGIFKTMNFPVAKNGQNTIPNIGFPFGRL